MIKELFKFTEIKLVDSVETIVATNTFTSSKKTETYDSLVYYPVVIGRDRTQHSSKTSKSNLKIKLSMNNDFAIEWINKDDSILRLERYKVVDSVVTSTWKGRMVYVESDGKYITIVFESIFSSLRSYGIRRVFQRTCNHSLFSQECGVTRSAYEVSGSITVMAEYGDYRVLSVSSVSSYDDGYFTFGSIVDSNGNSRMIADHSSATITISKRCKAFEEAFDEDGVVSVKLYPGCIKSRSECENKYSNSINFGGFPYLPVKDYFDKITVI